MFGFFILSRVFFHSELTVIFDLNFKLSDRTQIARNIIGCIIVADVSV